MRKFGTRSEVFDGQATMTRGGLKKDDLMSRTMKIVSKKKSEMAKASYAKYGFRSRAKEEPKEESKEEPKEVKKAKKTKRRRKKNVAE